MQTYIVNRGDTLYGISNQFGVSVAELINLNNVNPNNLQIGTVLIIPSNSGTNPNEVFNYTVKKGDTLYGIAIKYNTTVSAIQKLNNLNGTSLSIGQVLKIPEYYTNGEMELPEYINYTVKRGDNLYSIAKNNNLSLEVLIKDNGLTSDNLSIGQVLKIRVKDEDVLECFGEDYNPPIMDNTTNYIVKKGDSLYKIANAYNTSVSTIQKLNNLNSTNLSIGQVLKIPVSSNTYIVKKGDSLYQIAKQFNTTVDAIKKKNNLTTNLLSIGQKLII